MSRNLILSPALLPAPKRHFGAVKPFLTHVIKSWRSERPFPQIGKDCGISQNRASRSRFGGAVKARLIRSISLGAPADLPAGVSR